MQISPVNNVSFGKLIIADDEATQSTIKKHVKHNQTFEYVQKALDQLDRMSEDRNVILSAGVGDDFDKSDTFTLTDEKTGNTIAKKGLNENGTPNKALSTSITHVLDRFNVALENYIHNIKNTPTEDDYKNLFQKYSNPDLHSPKSEYSIYLNG